MHNLLDVTGTATWHGTAGHYGSPFNCGPAKYSVKNTLHRKFHLYRQLRGAQVHVGVPMPIEGHARALQLLQNAPRPPQLIVFDLDYTLWPFWCEMYTVRDEPSLYPESRGILDACRELHIPMAIASRTPTPNVAQAFMKKLGFDHHSAQKDTAHFPAIQRELGIPYSEMLFFDDESSNISKVARLGVTSILVPSGMSVDILKEGLEQHAKK